MFEHVGQAQLSEYFARIWRMLEPGGLLLNHAIGRLAPHPPADRCVHRPLHLPRRGAAATGRGDRRRSDGRAEPRDVESLREHYPPTLRSWVANLRARREEATALVGTQRVRAWELYMLSSALGFEDADITVYQILATRGDGPHPLPLDRSRLLESRRETAAA